MALIGRTKIYTDEKEINSGNIRKVLGAAYGIHQLNVADMDYLLLYERGVQPLPRQKVIRPEIDIQTQDNLANYVKEFKVGYFWGTPAMLVQRANKEPHDTDPEIDDSGISALNEMLQNGNQIGKLDQELAEFVEICGVGYRIVDVKTDYDDNEIPDTYANIYTLDPRTTFCVYYNGIGGKKLMGVTYNTPINGGTPTFTCFTDKYQYEIKGNRIVSETINPFGMIPIVEYDRAVDRTGCFERQISLMDNLNSMVSDFADDIAQKTQEIWWGNDVDFPQDDAGNDITPTSGQWVLTFTGEGKNPKIQPLSSSFDSDSTLSAIADTRMKVLQNCKVPIQYTSSAPDSTGVAADVSTGWSATEVDALREERLIESGKREELILTLKAINLAPTSVLATDNPLRQLHSSDIEFHFNRRKNYDMATKANALGVLLSHGINGRHALKMIDAFPDVEQTWLDSQEGIEAYQRSIYGENDTNEADEHTMTDDSDQVVNSPFIDGMDTITNPIQA